MEKPDYLATVDVDPDSPTYSSVIARAEMPQVGDAPGGFLHLDENFDVVGRWENDISGMNYNYDFWYQPRHNMMVSSERAGAVSRDALSWRRRDLRHLDMMQARCGGQERVFAPP